MVDSMLVIIPIGLIGCLMLVGFVMYVIAVTDSRADIQLDHLKAYSCEEIMKKHAIAHYMSKENKQYANQKVQSCDKAT